MITPKGCHLSRPNRTSGTRILIGPIVLHLKPRLYPFRRAPTVFSGLKLTDRSVTSSIPVLSFKIVIEQKPNPLLSAPAPQKKESNQPPTQHSPRNTWLSPINLPRISTSSGRVPSFPSLKRKKGGAVHHFTFAARTRVARGWVESESRKVIDQGQNNTTS